MCISKNQVHYLHSVPQGFWAILHNTQGIDPEVAVTECSSQLDSVLNGGWQVFNFLEAIGFGSIHDILFFGLMVRHPAPNVTQRLASRDCSLEVERASFLGHQ
jgi:hypothetical protein